MSFFDYFSEIVYSPELLGTIFFVFFEKSHIMEYFVTSFDNSY